MKNHTPADPLLQPIRGVFEGDVQHSPHNGYELTFRCVIVTYLCDKSYTQ